MDGHWGLDWSNNREGATAAVRGGEANGTRRPLNDAADRRLARQNRKAGAATHLVMVARTRPTASPIGQQRASARASLGNGSRDRSCVASAPPAPSTGTP